MMRQSDATKLQDFCNYNVRRLPQRFVMQSIVQAMQFVLDEYHKLESGRHTRYGACGHRSEARSSVAERCRYMAEEGVRILPRLPGRPVPRV